MPRKLIVFLVLITLVRLTLGLLFPITADESYYWLWSKHLALSYVEHPPMVGIINYLLTLGNESLIMIRLGTALIALLVSFLIYFLSKKLFNEKVALWSTIIFQILPHFLVIWLTMFVELPLVLFWTASLLLLSLIIKDKNTSAWYLLSLMLGLGYLSKYTMFLFWPSLALFFFLVPEQRFWLKRKEPYLCFIISLLFFLPILYWNSLHSFVSFTFHSSRVGADPFGTHFLEFIGDQFVHFTPFLIFALFGAYKYAYKKNKLLFSFSFFPLLLFLLLSFKTKIWAHWPALAYIGAIPLTVNYLIEQKKNLKFFIVWISIFSSLVLIILLFVTPGVLLHQKDYNQNYSLRKLLPRDAKIFAQTNVSSSLLEFFTGRQTYLATGFLKKGQPWGEQQYNIWGIPDLARGETVFYYGEDNKDFLKYFTKVSDTGYKLFLVEDYINKYKIFKLEGYKGGDDHP